MLTHLRTLWISFAHDNKTSGVGTPAEHVATLAEIHAELTRSVAQ
jgi:hypothetical protein